MTHPEERLAVLLEQITSGRSSEALPELDHLLSQAPENLALLGLRAEALRLTGRLVEAVEAFRHAASKGAGVRNWLAAGVLLAAMRSTDDALQCLRSANEEAPDNEEVLDALITTCFNANRQHEGIEFARRQLTVSANPRLLTHAALLLQSNDLYAESSGAFKTIIALAPEDPAVRGAALVPARFTCEWEWVEALQQKIGAWYDQGAFDAPQEYPLTHLTWCTDEARNLGVTQAYVKRMVPAAEPLPARAAAPLAGRRIRVGYVSCDFRNHATMHLMAGLFEAHDRNRFEVFAYDYSAPDVSAYRQRFTEGCEHVIAIHAMTDQQAAERMAADQLDILFDLKLYTGGGRPGIMAYRPAPLQVAYLGYPGSAANTDIDYIVSDRFVTPDSSTPFYPEAFCRLPHTYQCNDRKRSAAAQPANRAAHGLPEDKVVFGAFNQSYKIDRTSFTVWLRVLTEVPNSVLWLLGQCDEAITNLTHYAQLAGVDPQRLIFAPFAAPQDHLARLQLADAVLDTLVCNGHTTTSDALWAGVPVITSRGRHFSSRVSESLLNAIELPELVGADHNAMVGIAQRIGSDAEYRTALRAKVAANRLSTPLFDTLRFTRNFETAIEQMVQQHRPGVKGAHIDVPDCGPIDAAIACPAVNDIAAAPLQNTYPACPLCQGTSETLGFANCTGHELWHATLPPSVEWMKCTACGHVHTRQFWTPAGMAEVARKADAARLAITAERYDARRSAWAPVVDKVVSLMGGYHAALGTGQPPTWVDARCGDGALIMLAADYGFASAGLDTRLAPVTQIRQLGFNAVHQDFMAHPFDATFDVISMMDMLEHVPYPKEALTKAAVLLRPGGLLVVGLPDLGSSSWKVMDASGANPYWQELESYHHFSRERLIGVLGECGFEVVDLAIPNRYRGHVEVYARRV
ncbi:O-linked N-acetylglucosamine transferase family protein [Pseudomonas japonica]|uniref:O-linked N-acetylglucosamine transferase family protein n=1 Tax=Pseudomonas japonica TaxID=256466 RepID=UPI0015E2CE9F|nr:methyltransferase domain-containing protein [Pseudomonas japonica]MBA1241826.1 methyltransferase domain-containing protein [Pseudomonas japonica]